MGPLLLLLLPQRPPPAQPVDHLPHLRRSHKQAGNKDTEGFVTARGTQSVWRIAWSFYAGAVGSWVIVTPSQVQMDNPSSNAVPAWERRRERNR